MAEKMQPALLVTAHPAKKARKRKLETEKDVTNEALDKEVRPESTSVWRLSDEDSWGHMKDLKSDAEVALFLLDR